MAMHDDETRNFATEDLERTRATPLRPAVWMTGVLVWATVVALILRVPTWASVFLCTVTAISFLVFVVGYIYLFAFDREALRAERWRSRSDGKSREVTGQLQRELGEGSQASRVPRPVEGEPRIRVGDASVTRK